MYHQHVSIINAGMRADVDTFERGVTFAFLSIRTQFVRITQQMADLQTMGVNSRVLWGFKRGAYDYLRLNKWRLWETVSGLKDTAAAVGELAQIPGMGIVKSAFVCQMMGHDVGCLDTRNIQRLGLDAREWRTDGVKTGPAFKRKVDRYVDFTGGQAETLWNDWCEDVAGVYKVSAEEISRDHLIIVPHRLRKALDLKPVPVFTRHEIPFAA